MQLAHADAVYTVRQSFSVKDLPADSKEVREWLWMPEDRPGQKVLDFRVVEAPASLRITRDPRYGRSWLYAEASANESKPLRVVTEFKIVRTRISGMADASKTHALTADHRRVFALELRKDEKHMEVTPKIQKIADERSRWKTALRSRPFLEIRASAGSAIRPGKARDCPLIGAGVGCQPPNLAQRPKPSYPVLRRVRP